MTKGYVNISTAIDDIILLDEAGSMAVRQGKLLVTFRAGKEELSAFSTRVAQALGGRSSYDAQKDLEHGVQIFFVEPMLLALLPLGSCRYTLVKVRSAKFDRKTQSLQLIVTYCKVSEEEEEAPVRLVNTRTHSVSGRMEQSALKRR